MDELLFDELAKRLARGGFSRRRVLRGLGGGLLGAVAAGVGWRGTGAAPGDNSACAAFCAAVFPPGPARGDCVSQAAQGNGPCVECGAVPSLYCGGVCYSAQSIPDTPIGQQFAWVLEQINGGATNLTDAEIDEHFTSEFINAYGYAGITGVLQAFLPYAPWVFTGFSGTPTDSLATFAVHGLGAQGTVELRLDDGKIGALLLNGTPC